jgi:orotate phosphoribosyltransferase-like protein
MIQSEIVLYIIKLVLGGIAAFLAVMLWSKTRDAAWISLVAGAVTSYAGIVFEMLVKLGIIVPGGIAIAGIPLATMMFTVIPELFFILAFILMIARNK